jgi:hypothetical protein
VPYTLAANTDTPNPDPDPGEEYPHVNTQLFGIIDPPGNRGVLCEHMTAPFNAPAHPDAVPTMDGFVANRSFYHAASSSGFVINTRTRTSRCTTTPRPSSSGSMPRTCPGGCTWTPACACRSPG